MSGDGDRQFIVRG